MDTNSFAVLLGDVADVPGWVLEMRYSHQLEYTEKIGHAMGLEN